METNFYVKRILTEGKIKVGDFVKSESFEKFGVVVTKILENGDFITDERDSFEPDLFYILPTEKAIKVSKEFYLFAGEINLGKISSEAIWLKEGNEILENEFRIVVDLPEKLNWIEGREKLGYEKMILVKGECGHFH